MERLKKLTKISTKNKIFLIGGTILFLFVCLSFVNVYTYRKLLKNFQIRDDLHVKQGSVEEIEKWRNSSYISISNVISSGKVPKEIDENFVPPSQVLAEANKAFISKGKTIILLAKEKENYENKLREQIQQLTIRITNIYHNLDEEISTALAKAQMDEVLGFNPVDRLSLAPYVLKSLNQLTLIALNSIISKEYTKIDKGVVEKNLRFIKKQIHIIDNKRKILLQFENLYAQIKKIDELLKASKYKIARMNKELLYLQNDFNTLNFISKMTIENMYAKIHSEVEKANKKLKIASKNNLIILTIFLLGVPIALVIIAIFGLNRIIIDPIAKLIKVMKKIEQGDYSVNAKVIENNEIGLLAKSFNKMASEIKNKVQELEKSERKYRTLVDSLPQKIFLKDVNSVFVSCNKNLAEDLGLDPSEIVGKTDYDFFPKVYASKYRQDDQYVMNTGITAELEERYVNNGEEFFIQTVKTPFRNEKGEVVGLLGIFWDITEKKKAEKEKERLKAKLLQSQKMEAIGTLAGGIAHDFNNILSPIILGSEMFLDDPSLSPDLQESMKIIYKSANRAKSLVKKILTFGRKSETIRKALSLKELLREAIDLLRASIPSSVDIKYEVNIDNDSIIADATEIHQVIMNISTNAAYAMKKNGGTLKIALTQEYFEGSKNIKKEDGIVPGDYVKLTISDTGCGIDKGTISRIFEPFFSTKEKGKGTGLGLSVVHGIVKELGGAISVNSELGVGTTFEIYFPLASQKECLDEINFMDQIYFGNERILIIDDENNIIDSLRLTLQKLGYQVFAINNSKRALEIFSENPEAFDLIITDQTMPGMSGDELAQEILKISPKIPIILCSGYDEVMNKERAQEIGIKKYLTKPINMKDIACSIRGVIEESLI